MSSKNYELVWRLFKTTLKSPVSEQINKVSNILSAPSRCSSRYPYTGCLRWRY